MADIEKQSGSFSTKDNNNYLNQPVSADTSHPDLNTEISNTINQSHTFDSAAYEDNSNQEMKNDVDSSMNISDYMVAFSSQTKCYCVGCVDMKDSTKISSMLGNTRMPRYYHIFLNSMSKILSRFGGFVIKNVGDSILFYFPESSKSDRRYGFMSCLEGILSMCEYRNHICSHLHDEDLPCVDFRVSADYGSVVLMKSNNSTSMDMIGPPVNMCTKINYAAATNGAVIGGDLYSMVKSFDDYKFKEVKGFSLGFKHAYPVYEIRWK